LEQAEALASEAPRQNVQTTKDDIVRLLHLFKEPTAQWHWTNLYGILNRAELDARKAGSVYSEAANPLNNLAEIFNNYDEFTPQNEMVEYESPGMNMRPIKKNPYKPSTSEWAYLSAFTNDLEPTNLSRRTIVRGPDWIKSTWTDCRKYLHQMFINYNRSGQHDDDKDEWGSEKELRRWCRAARWNPHNGSSGCIIRYQTAMIYSVAVLDLSDFEAVGRKMPTGTGVDATIDNNAVVPNHKRKRRSTSKKSKEPISIARIMEVGDAREAKISTLKVLLQYGTTDAIKAKAQKELLAMAFGENKVNDDQSVNELSDESDDDSVL
jgi:hypothetical protein